MNYDFLIAKQKDSHNWDKAKAKVAKLQKHISNQRLDFLHKKSYRDSQSVRCDLRGKSGYESYV